MHDSNNIHQNRNIERGHCRIVLSDVMTPLSLTPQHQTDISVDVQSLHLAPQCDYPTTEISTPVVSSLFPMINHANIAPQSRQKTPISCHLAFLHLRCFLLLHIFDIRRLLHVLRRLTVVVARPAKEGMVVDPSRLVKVVKLPAGSENEGRDQGREESVGAVQPDEADDAPHPNAGGEDQGRYGRDHGGAVPLHPANDQC
mmetsp:Transcript_33520/g.61900  ORF Transcript_33520/g.61900 Transcript_33520/m.61900 type:complete len:200 (-) Transcript_33520:802-1401(-)